MSEGGGGGVSENDKWFGWPHKHTLRMLPMIVKFRNRFRF